MCLGRLHMCDESQQFLQFRPLLEQRDFSLLGRMGEALERVDLLLEEVGGGEHLVREILNGVRLDRGM